MDLIQLLIAGTWFIAGVSAFLVLFTRCSPHFRDRLLRRRRTLIRRFQFWTDETSGDHHYHVRGF